MRIQAWTCLSAGAPLQWQEYDAKVDPGQIVIDVDSCSLTRGDVRFIDDYWHGTEYPLVTGLEIIGRIREDTDPNPQFKAGEVVGVGYQVGACFSCEYCRAGEEQFCLKQQLIPFQAKGGLADAIVVDRRFVFRMPANLQKPEATPLLCSGLTVFRPISAQRLARGAKVGVVGLGSLGHLAVLFLAAMGHEVTVFTHSTHKVGLAKEMGARTVITNSEAAPERYFDFILSCSSDGIDWQRYIQALKPDGTLCIVGLPSDPVTFPAELLADFVSRRIMGSYIGSRADMKQMLEFAGKHNIVARAAIFPMRDVNRAIDDRRDGKVDFSAVLVRG